MSINIAVLADADGVLCKVVHKPEVESVILALLQNVEFDYNHKKAFEAIEKTRGHAVCYTMHEGLCFLCAADGDVRQRIMFSFLDSIMLPTNDLADNWHENHLGKQKSGTFEKFMEDEMEFYSHNPDADRIRGLMDKISTITDVMQDNMHLILQREEKNDVILKKADRVQERSTVFEMKTKQVRCQQFVYSCCPICCCCYCCCRPCWQSEKCANCTIM